MTDFDFDKSITLNGLLIMWEHYMNWRAETLNSGSYNPENLDDFIRWIERMKPKDD